MNYIVKCIPGLEDDKVGDGVVAVGCSKSSKSIQAIHTYIHAVLIVHNLITAQFHNCTQFDIKLPANTVQKI